MRVTVVAVGQRLPAWAQSACEDYLKRFGNDFKVEVKAVKAALRGQSGSQQNTATLQAAEQPRIVAALPRGALVVALDVLGQACSTKDLATRLVAWQLEAKDLAFVIGGADGLAPELLKSADWRMSLSALTLPHALARVVLLEQLYRAWSLNNGHPYHRE